MCHVALSFVSLRRLIRPPHREYSAASIEDVIDVKSTRHPAMSGDTSCSAARERQSAGTGLSPLVWSPKVMLGRISRA
jgi:hypothetical protein